MYSRHWELPFLVSSWLYKQITYTWKPIESFHLNLSFNFIKLARYVLLAISRNHAPTALAEHLHTSHPQTWIFIHTTCSLPLHQARVLCNLKLPVRVSYSRNIVLASRRSWSIANRAHSLQVKLIPGMKVHHARDKGSVPGRSIWVHNVRPTLSCIRKIPLQVLKRRHLGRY